MTAPPPLEQTVQVLGEGGIVTLSGGETLFKLDSHPANPIVRPADLDLVWQEDGERRIGAVFNAGAELVNGTVILTPRCQQGYRRRTLIDEATGKERTCFEDYLSEVWTLVSSDGVHFERGDTVIRGDGTDHDDFTHGIEDVRIIRNGSGYLLVGSGKLAPANGCAPTISQAAGGADRPAVYVTEDFTEITYCGIVPAFDTRNAFPLPEPIGGQRYMLLRSWPHMQLDVLEAGVNQILHPEEHRDAWARTYERRKETVLLEAGLYPHEREKIGAGPPVIRTEWGWLLLYHALGEIPEDVCNAYGIEGPIERGYSVNAALLALDDPRRVLCRTRQPIYIPSKPYELYGDDEFPVDVPAVVFATGAVVRGGKLLVYAGAGDKYIVLLSCSLAGLIDYLWEHCRADGGD